MNHRDHADKGVIVPIASQKIKPNPSKAKQMKRRKKKRYLLRIDVQLQLEGESDPFNAIKQLLEVIMQLKQISLRLQQSRDKIGDKQQLKDKRIVHYPNQLRR